MFRLREMLVMMTVGGLLVFATGCGGASDSELQQARLEGAKEARQALTLKQIKRGIATLKKQKNKGTATPVASPTTSTYSGSGPSKTCSSGIGASSATSCEFAYNVAGTYMANPGATSIVAFSPVTGQDYTMTCSPWSGGGTVCRGGNDAAVFIP